MTVSVTGARVIDLAGFVTIFLITTISFKTYLFFNIIFGVLLGFISSNLGVSNYLD